MPQEKRAAGHHTDKAPKHTKVLPSIFANIPDLRQAVLRAARIEDHAERAGFRRGRYGKWHCGNHADRHPSCTIRDGRICCWVCGEAWNVIDLEMLATGEPFLRALRALAGEYGLRIDSEAYDPRAAKRAALERQGTREQAFNWRAGFLEQIDEMLTTEKARLFDPIGGAANESLILVLTRWERIAREARGERDLIAVYRAISQCMPELSDRLSDYGERRRYERQAALLAFIDLMAESVDRW